MSTKSGLKTTLKCPKVGIKFSPEENHVKSIPGGKTKIAQEIHKWVQSNQLSVLLSTIFFQNDFQHKKIVIQ